MRKPNEIKCELKAFSDTFENKHLSHKNREFVRKRIVKLTGELLDARAKEIEDALDFEDDDISEGVEEFSSNTNCDFIGFRQTNNQKGCDVND